MPPDDGHHPHPDDPWHPSWDAATDRDDPGDVARRMAALERRLDTPDDLAGELETMRRAVAAAGGALPRSEADTVAESPGRRSMFRRRGRKPAAEAPPEVTAPAEEDHVDIVDEPADDRSPTGAAGGDDDFPWDDEDWSSARSGDDVPMPGETDDDASPEPAEDAVEAAAVAEAEAGEPEDEEPEAVTAVASSSSEPPMTEHPDAHPSETHHPDTDHPDVDQPDAAHAETEEPAAAFVDTNDDEQPTVLEPVLAGTEDAGGPDLEPVVETEAIDEEDAAMDDDTTEMAPVPVVAVGDAADDNGPDDNGPDDDGPDDDGPDDDDTGTVADAVVPEPDADDSDADAGDETQRVFTHAEVIPLIRVPAIPEEEATAGVDPDLMAVAERDSPGADDGADEKDPEPEPAGGDTDDTGDTDDGEGSRTEGYVDPFTDFLIEDYARATTEEYAALAREVAESETQELEMAAVSAEMPGMESTLVSLDDMVDAGLDVGETVATARRSDLGLRVVTGIGLLILFFGSLLYEWAIGGLILVVLSIAALELYIVFVNSGYRPLSWAGLAGVIGALAGTWVWGVVAVPIALGATAIGTALFTALSARRRTPMIDLTLTVAVMTWLGVLGAPAFEIIQSPDYRWLVLALVLATAVMDVAQYFVGRSIGRRPLAPVVSPKKTIEGLVGGVFAAVLVGVVLGSIESGPFTLGAGLAFGLMVGAVAPFGDLAVSVVKRTLDVKDMGTILPGHGGVLDRIDAMVFVIPSAWVLYQIFGML